MCVLAKKEENLLVGRSINDARSLYEGRRLGSGSIYCIYEKSVEA